MKFLLDTNACIELLRGRGELIRARLEVLGDGQAVLCSVVRYELLRGAMRSRERDRNISNVHSLLARFASLALDDQAADHAAEIDGMLTASGSRIGINDILIAAICVAHQCTLVTHNIADFSRVHGLAIEDWQAGGTAR